MEGGGAPRAIPEGMGVAMLGCMGRAVDSVEGGAMLMVPWVGLEVGPCQLVLWDRLHVS